MRVIHWKAAEAEPLLDALRHAGFDPEYDGCADTQELGRVIRNNPPDAIVIDLSRLPSHGRAVATWLRGSKALRQVPLVFVNGVDEKVAKLREQMPEAVHATTRTLKATLTKALRSVPPAPTVTSVMEQYKERTAAQKLGIDNGGSVGVIDAPRGYLTALGTLPEDIEIIEEPEQPAATTLWFVHDPEALFAALRRMWTIAARTRLWILWRKGSTNGLTQLSIREAAREAGLVDYKICAVNREWSGMLFARKKA
ncbi:MAG TPA: hypothetical protein VNH18_32235 [Bryobacteraceae bacterium]|nr:hypothetical protein [Bryobacteraceae bacterium]